MSASSNSLIAEFEVVPYYGQIAILDPDTIEIPDWDTGRERAVATQTCLLIATRSDADGPLAIRVFSGHDQEPGLLVFDGNLNFSTSNMQIGSIVGADLRDVELSSPGEKSVRVFLHLSEAISAVAIVIEHHGD